MVGPPMLPSGLTVDSPSATQKDLIYEIKMMVLADLGVHSGTTSQRPTASVAGTGFLWYDTTLSKPVWSDGVTWRDAAGVVA